jgi:hypothetical protein
MYGILEMQGPRINMQVLRGQVLGVHLQVPLVLVKIEGTGLDLIGDF